MANISVSEVLDADFCDPVTVLRQVAMVGSDGILQVTVNPIQITASIQSSGDSLMMQPDLARTEGAYEIITTFPLLTATDLHAADMVVWNGRQHRVISIGRFGNFSPGMGHYEGVMEVVTLNPVPTDSVGP